MSYYIGNRKYTRAEIYNYLIEKGQIITYEKTRKNYKKEVAQEDTFKLYIKNRQLFAVI